MLMMYSQCYSFDLLENSDSNRKASITSPATFNFPDANAFTHKQKYNVQKISG